MSRYEVVIGLEVHAQLATSSKLFNGAPAHFDLEANRHTDPHTLGLPGTLPVLNERAVECAARLGLAVGSRVNTLSVFARKNYFYPDLPKNYQISQYELPICSGGAIQFELDGEMRAVELERIHLEEDAGKSLHVADHTRIDLNRAGVALVEIVSKPVLRQPREAGAYLQALRQLVRYLDVCDGNMEQGSLRCDANISLRPSGQAELGTKIEIKNLNSISGIVQALEYEVQRQSRILDEGGELSQETRGFDPDRGTTHFLRGKEDAQDYRYFPDPDLPPLVLDPAWLDALRAALPTLPRERRQALRARGIAEADVAVLTESRELADYVDGLIAACGEARLAANWVQGEVLRACNARGLEIGQFPIDPRRLAGLLALLREQAINQPTAKEIFERMLDDPAAAAEIVDREGLRQLQDEGALSQQIEQILDSHPAQLQQYLDGKESVAAFFVGQLMRATRGKANPQLANELVQAALARRKGAK